MAARLTPATNARVAVAPRQLKAPVGAQLRRHADHVPEPDQQRAVQQRLHRQQPRRRARALLRVRVGERDDRHRESGRGGARQRQAMRVAAPHRRQREIEARPRRRIADEQRVGQPPARPPAAPRRRRRRRRERRRRASHSTGRRPRRRGTPRRRPAPARRASAGNCRRRSRYSALHDADRSPPAAAASRLRGRSAITPPTATSYAPRNHIGGDIARQPSKPRCPIRSDATGSSRTALPSITISAPCAHGEATREPAPPEHGHQRLAQRDDHEIAERRRRDGHQRMRHHRGRAARTPLICRKLNTSIHGNTRLGNTLTAIATARAENRDRRHLGAADRSGAHRQRLENRRVARVDRQRVPLRRRDQRRDDHRQRTGRRTCRRATCTAACPGVISGPR